MITVHTFGVHYKWALPELLRDQLRLAHDLREDLVTLQLDYEQRVKAIWSSYPTVNQIEADLAVAQDVAERASEKLKAERVRQWTKRPVGGFTEAYNDARQQVRLLRLQRREAIKDVRDDAKGQREIETEALKAEQKQLYAIYCQDHDPPLFWATYNAVLDHHRVAVQRISKARGKGQPAQLRHHRFDGSGSINVQVQRQAREPKRTPALIADSEKGRWRNVLMVPWIPPEQWDQMSRTEQWHAGRIKIRMRCGPGWLEIPVQADRMFPADADITGAQLTVRRVAAGFRARVSITAKIKDPEEVTSGPAVALHLGWRNEPNGIRVATWRADEPLSLTTEEGDLLGDDGHGRRGVIIMPASFADRLERIDKIRAKRDLALDAVKAQLVEWLTVTGPLPHPTREGEEITATDVARWRSPARFAVLALAWRDDEGLLDLPTREALEAWRRADKTQWDGQEHGRAKIIAGRDELYKVVASIFARRAGRLVVDDMSIADLARLSNDDLPAGVERQIAHRRTIAAPGMLRSAAVAACIREGVPVITVSSEHLSRTHARCGFVNPSDDRFMQPPVRCDGCGALYNPDASAVVLMLKRARELMRSSASAPAL